MKWNGSLDNGRKPSGETRGATAADGDVNGTLLAVDFCGDSNVLAVIDGVVGATVEVAVVVAYAETIPPPSANGRGVCRNTSKNARCMLEPLVGIGFLAGVVVIGVVAPIASPMPAPLPGDIVWSWRFRGCRPIG